MFTRNFTIAIRSLSNSTGYVPRIAPARLSGWSSNTGSDVRRFSNDRPQSQKVVDSLGGRRIEFNRDNARGHQDYSEMAQSATKTEDGLSGVQGTGIDDECYQPMSNVSLHSVMQSSVPHPYQSSTHSMHKNMPRGNARLDDKFLSGERNDANMVHNRKFCTSCFIHRFYSTQEKVGVGVQGIQGTMESRASHLPPQENPSAQGVQGDDDEQYRLFLENCSRHNIGNCEEVLEEVKAGRMTIEEAYAEQARRLKAKEEGMPKVGTAGVPKQLNRRQQLKQAVKDYGATVVVFHIGISLISLGGFYLAVSSGVDVAAMLAYLGLGEGSMSKLATNASTFVVAYAVHKVFAPVRITITLSATPFIVHYLRRIGFLKVRPVK